MTYLIEQIDNNVKVTVNDVNERYLNGIYVDTFLKGNVIYIIYRGENVFEIDYNNDTVTIGNFSAFTSASHINESLQSVIKDSNKQTLNSAAYTPYNATIGSSIYPVVSGNAVYGFIPSNFRTYTSGSGTVITEENLFEVFSGTSLGDFGAFRSFRSLNYKTGQGAEIRFSGVFENSEANTWSGIGGLNLGDEVSFGYNGLEFGVWHRYGGRAEVQSLQITGAAGGSENATVTINSVIYTVPLTSGTVQKNAYEIATYLNANSTIVEAEQVDDKVVINFLSDGDKTGTFAFTSGTATGTWTQLEAGVTKTSTHVPMDEWDLKNGTKDFDPTKGNSYKIAYKNGFGDIKYFIEDAQTGLYVLVHTITHSNSKVVTNLENPSLRLGAYATALGTISGVTLDVAYITGAIYGLPVATRNPRGYSNTKSIATTLTNIFTLKNSRTYNGRSNQVEVEPVFLTLANDGTKSAIFELRTGATLGGTPNFQEEGANLVSQFDVSGTTVTGGVTLASFTVAKGQSINIDLLQFRTRIPPSLTFTVAGKMASGSAADLSATLTWYEDI